jgi:hypothetical protein
MRVWGAMLERVGIRPLALPPPTGISWTGSLRTPIEQQCRTLPSVPYIEPHVPVAQPCGVFDILK